MNCFFQKTTLFRFSCFSPLQNVIKNTRNFSISTQQYNHSRDRDANGVSYSTTHSTGSLKQLQQLQFGVFHLPEIIFPGTRLPIYSSLPSSIQMFKKSLLTTQVNQDQEIKLFAFLPSQQPNTKVNHFHHSHNNTNNNYNVNNYKNNNNNNNKFTPILPLNNFSSNSTNLISNNNAHFTTIRNRMKNYNHQLAPLEEDQDPQLYPDHQDVEFIQLDSDFETWPEFQQYALELETSRILSLLPEDNMSEQSSSVSTNTNTNTNTNTATNLNNVGCLMAIEKLDFLPDGRVFAQAVALRRVLVTSRALTEDNYFNCSSVIFEDSPLTTQESERAVKLARFVVEQLISQLQLKNQTPFVSSFAMSTKSCIETPSISTVFESLHEMKQTLDQIFGSLNNNNNNNNNNGVSTVVNLQTILSQYSLHFAYVLSISENISFERKQQLLETTNIIERLNLIADDLAESMLE